MRHSLLGVSTIGEREVSAVTEEVALGVLAPAAHCPWPVGTSRLCGEGKSELGSRAAHCDGPSPKHRATNPYSIAAGAVNSGRVH